MTGAPGMPRRQMHLASGDSLILTSVLAKAGEGTVFASAHRPDLAAKVFHPSLKGLSTKLDKVAAMIQSPPPGWKQPDGFVVLTWPTEMIVEHGVPVGFVMPRIDTRAAVELHTMSNPSDRQDPMPNEPQWTRGATWEHLVSTATNLCLAVHVVHRVNAVVGDFQERNILISNSTQVTLVDCDSMQFTRADGRQYLCGVGRPEFTAPELAGLDLHVQPREKSSDLFALAIHIHQLLMAGNHPFLRGNWTGNGQQPDAFTLARSGWWAGGPGSPLRTHPLAPPLNFLPDSTQQLLVRAFSDGARDPGARPTADEWRDNLTRIHFTTCAQAGHTFPATASICPWCAIDARRASLGADAAASRRSAERVSRGAMTFRGDAVRKDSARSSTPQNGIDPRFVIYGLVAVVSIVVVLTAFILWAILSGASTFGAG